MEGIRKSSRKRSAILEALRSTTEHPSAEMLFSSLKDRIPELSLGTVYRNVAVLMEEGEVISVGTVAGFERYDARLDSHAHFVCTCCGSVTDVELDENLGERYGDALEKGFVGKSYALRISGLCDRCSGAK